ncbi:MAG: LEA type 2 family protein [Gemmatimonadaceae bacterium]|nr:LEA type 2 family protein [Gemmatimonadaceae bacterium]
MMRRHFAVAALAALALGGCASLGLGGFKEPIVHFNDAKIRGLGLSGGAMDIVLSVYNPNGFDLNATRLTYRLLVEEKELGTGALDHAFKVNNNDSTYVTIPVDFTYAGLGTAGRQLLTSGVINYRVLGDFTVSTPIGSFTRPYDQRGRFSSFGGPSQSR